MPMNPNGPKVMYVTGPIDSHAAFERMRGLAKATVESEPNESVVAFPAPVVTSIVERFRSVLDAETVILTADWATDPDARHDAQLAVWAGKVVKVQTSLVTPRVDGGDTPTFRVLAPETVQDQIDRGLQLPAFPAGGAAG